MSANGHQVSINIAIHHGVFAFVLILNSQQDLYHLQDLYPYLNLTGHYGDRPLVIQLQFKRYPGNLPLAYRRCLAMRQR
jgi:hypothetical protein